MFPHFNNVLNRHRTQQGFRIQLLVLLFPKNHIKLTAGSYLESKIELADVGKYKNGFSMFGMKFTVVESSL